MNTPEWATETFVKQVLLERFRFYAKQEFSLDAIAPMFMRDGQVEVMRQLDQYGRQFALVLLLDELCPGTSDIVSDAHHDEIFLEPSPEKLADVVTEDQLLELIRCGVRYDSEYDSLAMFV